MGSFVNKSAVAITLPLPRQTSAFPATAAVLNFRHHFPDSDTGFGFSFSFSARPFRLRVAAGKKDESWETPELTALRRDLKKENDKFNEIQFAAIPRKQKLADMKLFLEEVLVRYNSRFDEYVADEAATSMYLVTLPIIVDEAVKRVASLNRELRFYGERMSEISTTRSFAKSLKDLITLSAAIKDQNCEALLEEAVGEDRKAENEEKYVNCAALVADQESLMYDLVAWQGKSSLTSTLLFSYCFIPFLCLKKKSKLDGSDQAGFSVCSSQL